jgi:hypothetical protein
MPLEDTDLESYWQDIKATARIKPVQGRISNAREGLEIATLKVLHKLGEPSEAQQHLREVIGRVFEEWLSSLAGGTSAGMLEVVLQGQNLPFDELRDFVKTLPHTFLERAVAEGALSKRASGVHALLALELLQRTGELSDYSLRQDTDGTLLAEFRPHGGQDTLTFRLDESFDLEASLKEPVSHEGE